MDSSAMSVSPQKKLGRYELIREIARSNDIVYEGWDPDTQRRVAVKALNIPSAATSAIRHDRTLRFEREARAAARLHHPNIVTLFDFGTDQDQPYLVFEFADGPTLTDILLQKGPLNKQKAINYACQILAALSYAHSQGVIHRDIKPSNIFVCPGDHLKISDLGIARIESEDAVTRDGQIFGTPAYMAPEQVKGQPIDRRVDIWAAGAVLYQMLTGMQAFSGGSVLEIGSNVLNQEPDMSPIKDAGLSAVIVKALSKDREVRYSRAGEMVAALQDPLPVQPSGLNVPSIISSGAVTAGLPTVSMKPINLQRSSSGKRLAAWMAVCAVSAAIGAGAVLWQTKRTSSDELPPPPSPKSSTPAVVRHKGYDEILAEALEHNSLHEMTESESFRVLPRGTQLDQLDTWCRTTIGLDYLSLVQAWRTLFLDDLLQKLAVQPIRVADTFSSSVTSPLMPLGSPDRSKPALAPNQSSVLGLHGTDPNISITTESMAPDRPVMPPTVGQTPPSQSAPPNPQQAIPADPPATIPSNGPDASADGNQKVWPEQRATDLDDMDVLRRLNFHANHVKVLPGGIREYSGQDGVVRIR